MLCADPSEPGFLWYLQRGEQGADQDGGRTNGQRHSDICESLFCAGDGDHPSCVYGLELSKVENQ